MAELPPIIHSWTTPLEGAGRNLHAIDVGPGLVLIDGPLRRSDGETARDWLATLAKPVLAVLVTHAHPDHYYGLTTLLDGADVPIHATETVAATIRIVDELWQRIVPINFGEAETERNPRFPDATVRFGEAVEIAGVTFVARDLGAIESPADSVWTSGALPNAVFAGDLVMRGTHLGLLQGNTAGYIATARLLAEEAGPAGIFFAGHGALVPASGVAGQIAYLEAYRVHVRELGEGRLALSDDAKGELTRRMMLIEPTPLLAFHIAMGADAVAVELAAQPQIRRDENDTRHFSCCGSARN